MALKKIQSTLYSMPSVSRQEVTHSYHRFQHPYISSCFSICEEIASCSLYNLQYSLPKFSLLSLTQACSTCSCQF